MVFFSITADIILFSILTAVVVNIFYKLLVKQQDAKASRERIKELNAKMKEQQKSQNKTEVDVLFKEVMKEQGKIMRMSFKPMIISMIITLVSVPWIGAVYGEKIIELTDGKGEVLFNGGSIAVEGNSVSFEGKTCEMPCRLEERKNVFDAAVAGDAVKVSPVAALLPFQAPFVGNELRWLGWYLLSFFFVMMTTRKLMKIYL
ncbi:MAG: DUF106 domain-containing protein [Candidatus Aenigmarchaeota archaeon]|nr:DUF106 domain-containing protein [Candidatus Aenigmarchaeota archaeon]